MEIQPQDQNRPLQCAHCKNALDHTDSFCEHCGYPVKGTEEAKTEFHFQLSSKQLQLQDSGNIRKVMNNLYVVAAVFVVYAVVFYYINPSVESSNHVLITNLSMGVTFFLLARWSARKPVAAITSALALYLAVQLVNLLIEPATLLQGVILKVFV